MLRKFLDYENALKVLKKCKTFKRVSKVCLKASKFEKSYVRYI